MEFLFTKIKDEHLFKLTKVLLFVNLIITNLGEVILNGLELFGYGH